MSKYKGESIEIDDGETMTVGACVMPDSVPNRVTLVTESEFFINTWWMKAAQARVLAAQLIAAADYAEGV